MNIWRDTFQWVLPNIAFAIWKKRLRNLHYVQCLNIAPMKIAYALWPQWIRNNGLNWIYTHNLLPRWKRHGFYEILFFQVIIVMVKDKKRWTLKDAMSITISFMHYRNYITWTRVKLPVVFEEFDLVYVFWFLFFFFTIIVNWWKVNFSKNTGGLQVPQPPRFLRAWFTISCIAIYIGQSVTIIIYCTFNYINA